MSGKRLCLFFYWGWALLAAGACADSEEDLAAGPALPLRWRCEAAARPVEDPGDPAPAGLRGFAESLFSRQQAMSARSVRRLLQSGRYERALRSIDAGKKGELGEKAHYLKAWALVERAQATCRIPDALLALAELDEAAASPEAAALRASIEELLGMPDGHEAPWPDRFEAELVAARDGFVAGKIEAPAVVALVRRSLWYSRQFAEGRLLASWVAHRIEKGQSPELLAREESFLRLVAAELGGRDLMLRHSLDAISAVFSRKPAAGPTLAEAFRGYVAGMAAYEAQELRTAEALLTPVEIVFDRYDIPLAHWARFISTIRLSYKDKARGHAEFGRLTAFAEANGYLALEGRSRWLAATAQLNGNQFDAAVQGYRRAQEILERAGGPDAAVFANVLLAEAESRRGNDMAAWRHRRDAFREVPRRESLRRMVAMYWEAATALEHQGLGREAGPLHSLALALARRWGQPLGNSTSLHGEAMWLLAQGKAAEAMVRLREAEGWIAAMEESSLKQERELSQKSYLGRALGQLDPPSGEVLLREAMAEQRQAGNTLEVLDETHHYAAVLLRLGRSGEAVAALRQGLDDFEAAHAAAEEPGTRANLLAEARKVGDLLVRQYFEDGEPQLALAVAERLKRHRYERSVAPEGCSAVAWLEMHQAVWLSSYVTQETSFWWLSRGGNLLGHLEVPTARLDQALERLGLLIIQRSPRQAFLEPLGELDQLIAAPLGLHDFPDLTFLPDLDTLRLPLPGFYDRGRQRFLIEDTSLRLAAGLGAESPPAAGRDGRAVLLVGVSGADLSRELKELLAAPVEVEALATEIGASAAVLAGESIPAVTVFAELDRRPAVFHFAGHAVQNRLLPWESFLSLGAAGDVLTLQQLRQLDLQRLRLAVLSSCTSLDGLGERSDASFGLAGALVAAGAKSVLASSVAVADEKVLALMTPFYQAYWNEGTFDAPGAYQAAARARIAAPDPQATPADWMFWNVLERLDFDGTCQ